MSPRARLILVVAGILVVLLLAYFLLIRPRQSELADVRAQTNAARDETSQLETELARLEALQDNAPELEADLTRIRKLVPPPSEDGDVATFIFQVQQAANQAGVGFVQITPEFPKTPPEGAQLAEIRTTLTARGGYFAIQDFFRRLMDLDRALRIDLVTMRSDTSEGGETAGTTTTSPDEARIELSMTARIFFELPAGGAAPTAPGTTTPAPTTTAPAASPTAAP